MVRVLHKKEIFIFSMVAMDTALITLTYIIAVYLRLNFPLFAKSAALLNPLNYKVSYPVLLFSWLTILSIMRQYEPRRRWNMQDILFSIGVAVTVGTLLLLVFTYGVFHMQFSRLVLLYLWVIGIILLVLSRLFVRTLLRWFYTQDIAIRFVIITGFGEAAKNLAQDYKNYPEMLYKLRGFVVDKNTKITAKDKRWAKEFSEKGILGYMDDLVDIVRKEQVTYVVLTSQLPDREKLRDIYDTLTQEGVDVKIVPMLYELGPKFLDFDEIGTVPIIGLREIPMAGWEAVGKRLIDIVGSFVGLILLSPLFLVVAILIKKESEGPVFFVQERIGQFARPFKMYKFRTMYINHKNTSHKTERNDSRITRVGSFLRRTSIDELPQLVNVLKGDMSLVGPRPDAYSFLRDYSHWHKRRLYLRPGMTGLAQSKGIRGGGSTLSKDKTRLDIEYMKNQSLILDIKILFKTLFTVLFHKEAY